MPEENKQGGAQNKLGELFVEFTTKGLPSLLKNLNSVSANFLLGKNAATQFADTLTKPFKEAGNTATAIGKMSNALGTTYQEYQKLQMYIKSKNISEGILNDVANLEKAFQDYRAGLAGMPANISTALHMLGLEIDGYSGDFQSILTLLDQVEARTKGLSKDKRNQIFRQLGISSDWGYLWDRGGFNLRDAFTLSDADVEKNIKASESIAELNIAATNLKDTLIAQLTPAIIDLTQILTNFIANFKQNDLTSAIMGGQEAAEKALPGQSKILVGIGGAIGTYASNKTKQLFKGETTGQAAAVSLPSAENGVVIPFEYPQQIGGEGYMGGLPQLTNEEAATAAIPSNTMQNLTQTINITNQNNITGNNAQEIADKIAGINSQDIQYNQYQLQNLTGL